MGKLIGSLRRGLCGLSLSAVLIAGIFAGWNIVRADAARAVSLSKTSMNLTDGASKTLKVKGTTKKVSWTSGNKKVAVVKSSGKNTGKVTAKAVGTAKITAKVNGKKLTCKITVSKRRSRPEQVTAIVNRERKKRGLPAIKMNAKLNKAAKKRAKEIVQNFDHTRPDGESCFTVLEEYDVECRAAGENIAAGQRTAAAVMDGWMHSKGHKSNILSKDYGKIGVGFYQKAGTDYTYYWVQIFTD